MKQAIWKVDWHSKVVLITVIAVGLAGLLALYVNASPLRESDKEFMFAQSLYEEGEFDLAAVQFKKFIEIFPANINCSRAQYLLGMCFWNQKKYEEAISAFDRLVEEYLQSEWMDDGFYQMGESYYRLGDFEGAITSYRWLIKNYSQSNLVAPSLYSLGCIYIEQKDYDESLWAFRRLRAFPESNKTSEVCYIIAKILYKSKRYPEAISEYSIFVSTYPTSKYRPSAYLERGLAYFAEGDYSKARNDFAAVRVFFWLGLPDLDQYKEVMQAYEKALE